MLLYDHDICLLMSQKDRKVNWLINVKIYNLWTHFNVVPRAAHLCGGIVFANFLGK